METIKNVRERICKNYSANKFCLIQEQAGNMEAKCPNEAWDTEFEEAMLRRSGNNGSLMNEFKKVAKCKK